MTEDGTAPRPELVIIRRRGFDDLTAAKGGAWKIAYADFVTAMMAFFLVMWLINAANEATRAQVASYFNPIKLTDSSTGGKGLNDPRELRKKDVKPGSGDSAEHEAEAMAERDLVADPPTALEKVAEGEAKLQATDTPYWQSTESAVKDPLDPLAWQETSAAPLSHEDHGAESPAAESQRAEIPPAKALPPIADPRAEEMREAAERRRMTRSHASAPLEENGEHATEAAAAAARREEGARRALDIKARVLQAVGVGAETLPVDLEVEATPEGMLISLTDRTDFGMFTVGSTEPSGKLMELVAAIAATLRDQPGYIVVRGHTDSRPYRNRAYDNWQLSTSRAHMAHHMLLRGGLDEARVRRIEGVADRQPKDAARPDSPVNRRIDILLGQD